MLIDFFYACLAPIINTCIESILASFTWIRSQVKNLFQKKNPVLFCITVCNNALWLVYRFIAKPLHILNSFNAIWLSRITKSFAVS